MGLDSLGYFDVNCLDQIPDNYHGSLCTACFTGKYPIDISEAIDKLALEERLNKKIE